MGVERWAEEERKPQDGRKDDRRVAEDHGEDESEEEGMKRGVIHGTGGERGRSREAGTRSRPARHSRRGDRRP